MHAVKKTEFFKYVEAHYGAEVLEAVKNLSQDKARTGELNTGDAMEMLEQAVGSNAYHRIRGDHVLEFSVAADPARPLKKIDIEVMQLNDAFFKALGKEPEALREVSPRRFEEIVGALLQDMGCDVRVTPQTRDGGRDLIAVFNTPLGELLTIVECKRYRADRKVGIEWVERFLWAITQKDRASFGLMATTSSYSPEARQVARQYNYVLKLQDFEGLKEWIAKYGTWQNERDSLLWVPNNSE